MDKNRVLAKLVTSLVSYFNRRDATPMDIPIHIIMQDEETNTLMYQTCLDYLYRLGNQYAEGHIRPEHKLYPHAKEAWEIINR